MSPTTSTITTVNRIPFSTLRAFSQLFTSYTSDPSVLAEYFAGHWQSAEARRAAADRAAAHSRDRETLVDVLLDQNAAWGLDDVTRTHIEALADPEAVAVVTGQQTGLLGGPLYTPAKVITSLQMAEQLAHETGRTVVPIFWLEGEDHDLDEVSRVHVLRRNEPVELRYTGHSLPRNGNLGAVGRLTLGPAIRAVIDQLDEVLPDSDFKPAVMALVEASYHEEATLEHAFAHLLKGLFPDAGLVLMNPDDVRLKQLSAPLFEREIREPSASAEAVNRAGEQLRARFHQQVQARPTNLFLMIDGERRPIDLVDDAFQLRGTSHTFSSDELLQMAANRPERFSPNVVLRPLMQDTLLPTALYVGGPSEVAYFAQYRAVYEWAGLPMPLIHPRASLTLVESKVQKVLDKFELKVPDVEGDVDRLFQKVVLAEMEVDVDEVFQEALRPMHQAINGLKESVGSVDQTLTSSVEATRAALINEMEALKDRVVRAEKRNHDEIRAQLVKAHDNLFPSGTPQERVVSVLYFLNKYGPSLLAELHEALSTDTSEHQVVVL